MTETEPSDPSPDTPRGREATRLIRLDIPEGGYKRSKRPYVIALLVIVVVVGLAAVIQLTVFAPVKPGPDFNAAQDALGNTHHVDDLSRELLVPNDAKPCPGVARATTVTLNDAAAFVNADDAALLTELALQKYDTGVRGCFINSDGVKIETQIFRVGSQGGARTAQQREFDVSIEGDDISTARGYTVITGREIRTGPLVTFVYGYRGVLMVTLKASPVTAATIDPATIGDFYDQQMIKIADDGAQ